MKLTITLSNIGGKLESRTVESKQRRTLPVEELAAETAIDIINECGELHAGDTITVVAAD